MTPEETKAAESYAEHNDGNFQYCSDWSEVVEIFLAGVAYSRANPSAEVLAMVEEIETLSKIIVKPESMYDAYQMLFCIERSLEVALSAWRKARGGC